MIISLGEALIDFVGEKELSFNGFPGGSPYNTAIAISRLGIECRFLGRISRDLFGKKLVDYLNENNVGTDLVLRTDDKTTLSFVEKQKDGQACYAFFSNDAADRNWKVEELASIEIPADAQIIHFGSISFSQEPGGTAITGFLEKNSRFLLSFDPNIRPSIIENRKNYMDRFERICRISTIIKLSDEDLKWIFPRMSREQSLKNLLDYGISLIALTEGKEGASLINKKGIIKTPVFKLSVADTIGAGDTFHGALLTYIHKKKWFDRMLLSELKTEDLEAMGNFANKAAAINCSRSGANPPTEGEMSV
jgi:fructokinase